MATIVGPNQRQRPDDTEARFKAIKDNVDYFMANPIRYEGVGQWEVYEFIRKFRTRWAGDVDNFEEVLLTNFIGGYCLMFARILKMTFRRGSVVLAYPFSHCVWKDSDGILWDIRGRYRNPEGCYPEAYIPIDCVPEEGIWALEHRSDSDDEQDWGNWELKTFLRWVDTHPTAAHRYMRIRDDWLVTHPDYSGFDPAVKLKPKSEYVYTSSSPKTTTVKKRRWPIVKKEEQPNDET